MPNKCSVSGCDYEGNGEWGMRVDAVYIHAHFCRIHDFMVGNAIQRIQELVNGKKNDDEDQKNKNKE